MEISDLYRGVVGALAVPHELGHALPAVVVRLPYTITLFPDWEGDVTPIGRFNADVDEETPAWLIRAVAVAPLPVFLAVAGLFRVAVAPPMPVAIVALVLCSFWATLSGGDIAVARKPAEAKRAGELLVTVTPRERVFANLSTVATTFLVGVVLLA